MRSRTIVERFFFVASLFFYDLSTLECHAYLHISLNPAIFKNTNSILDSPDTNIPRLPYDNRALPVKRIDAFRIDDHVLGKFSFRPIPTHAPLPEVIASPNTGQRMQQEPPSPFQNRLQSVYAGTELYSDDPDLGEINPKNRKYLAGLNRNS